MLLFSSADSADNFGFNGGRNHGSNVWIHQPTQLFAQVGGMMGSAPLSYVAPFCFRLLQRGTASQAHEQL